MWMAPLTVSTALYLNKTVQSGVNNAADVKYDANYLDLGWFRKMLPRILEKYLDPENILVFFVYLFINS